jgi:type IV secretory pathway TraG/TraD family ATPase VirD4
MSSFWNYFGEIPDDGKKSSTFWEFFSDSEGPSEPVIESIRKRPCAVAFDEKSVFWGMRNIPLAEAVKHFLICGAVGSGKTTNIDLFVQSIAPRFHRDRRVPEQLILFDAKGDAIPKLAALGYLPDTKEHNVTIINPYDCRSAIWNVAEAVQEPLMAEHLAALLVPEEPNSSAPFYWSASRRLTNAVILALNQVAGKRWQLRDLLCALNTKERITAITDRHPGAREMAAPILQDDLHRDAVIGSLAAKLGKYTTLAALNHTAPRQTHFSVEDFLTKPGILILGNDPVLRQSLWPINALLLQSLSKHILRGNETQTPRHWFVLDEFSAMERVDSIRDLVNLGRSKGASVTIGLQGVDRIRLLYGKEGAEDILEQLSCKTFLRVGGPETAEWAERFFGRYRVTETTYSESFGISGKSASAQYNTTERSLFLASFFMNLPITGPGRPLIGVSDFPHLDTTVIARRWYDQVDSWRIKPSQNDAVPAVVPRTDPAGQTLEPWSKDRETHFCGKKLKQPKKPKLPNRKPKRPPGTHEQ